MKPIADFTVGLAIAGTLSVVPVQALAPPTFAAGQTGLLPEILTPVASSGAKLSATPTSGRAPLTVSFRAEGPPRTPVGSAIDFGDGTAGILQPAPVCFGCNSLAIAQHTYTNAGTYPATLLAEWLCPEGQLECAAPSAAQSMGSVTISALP